MWVYNLHIYIHVGINDYWTVRLENALTDTFIIGKKFHPSRLIFYGNWDSWIFIGTWQTTGTDNQVKKASLKKLKINFSTAIASIYKKY